MPTHSPQRTAGFRVAAFLPVLLPAFLPAFLLAGCVDSAAPLLSETQPLLGMDVTVHVFALGEDRASPPAIGIYHWDGHAYRAVNKPEFEVASFTAAPLAGNDLVLQSRSARPQIKGIEYALARKIANGVYMVSAIDEADADDATRAKYCAGGGTDTCHVSTPEGLLALARAAAAKAEPRGSLAVLVGESKP